MSVRIGVIGGSGLYKMEGLEVLGEERVSTPLGDPSDAVILGRLQGTDVAFLPRHGRGHVFTPTTVPYRANILALKSLGVEWILSVSAVGSLREDIVPGDMVVIDQFIDRTRSRVSTFFDTGIVAHVGFGDPVCGTLRRYLLESAQEAGAKTHDGGTYVCMEGPAFSTKAESQLYRSWGASVIGMTNVAEAKLAREAEISYATLAMATDYDCWHPGHDHVTVDQVIAVLQQNVTTAQRILAGAVRRVAAHEGPAPQANALKNAIMTAPSAVDPEKRRQLDLLVRKYL